MRGEKRHGYLMPRDGIFSDICLIVSFKFQEDDEEAPQLLPRFSLYCTKSCIYHQSCIKCCIECVFKKPQVSNVERGSMLWQYNMVRIRHDEYRLYKRNSTSLQSWSGALERRRIRIYLGESPWAINTLATNAEKICCRYLVANSYPLHHFYIWSTLQERAQSPLSCWTSLQVESYLAQMKVHMPLETWLVSTTFGKLQGRLKQHAWLAVESQDGLHLKVSILRYLVAPFYYSPSFSSSEIAAMLTMDRCKRRGRRISLGYRFDGKPKSSSRRTDIGYSTHRIDELEPKRQSKA